MGSPRGWQGTQAQGKASPSHDHTRIGLYISTTVWFICTALQTSQVPTFIPDVSFETRIF